MPNNSKPENPLDAEAEARARASWEQRLDESARAYAAFKAFLDMTPDVRTVNGAYRQAKGRTKATPAPGVWRTWSSRFDWFMRAEAHDRNRAAIERQAEERAYAANRQKWASRRIVIQDDAWTLADLLIAKAKEVLLMPAQTTRTVTESKSDDGLTLHQTIVVEAPRTVTFNNAVQMLNLSDRMRRLAADMATERVLIENLEERERRIFADARDALRETRLLFPDEPLEQRAANIAEGYSIPLEKLLDGYAEDDLPFIGENGFTV